MSGDIAWLQLGDDVLSHMRNVDNQGNTQAVTRNAGEDVAPDYRGTKVVMYTFTGDVLIVLPGSDERKCLSLARRHTLLNSLLTVIPDTFLARAYYLCNYWKENLVRMRDR